MNKMINNNKILKNNKKYKKNNKKYKKNYKKKYRVQGKNLGKNLKNHQKVKMWKIVVEKNPKNPDLKIMVQNQ